ncbi:MAG TPA: hypothetical protein VHB51_01335 [Candidatus Saccharimonadales bacterium]|nr:hypothetical protein [Candidatus Saccharimonadales bacterium]
MTERQQAAYTWAVGMWRGYLAGENGVVWPTANEQLLMLGVLAESGFSKYDAGPLCNLARIEAMEMGDINAVTKNDKLKRLSRGALHFLCDFLMWAKPAAVAYGALVPNDIITSHSEENNN